MNGNRFLNESRKDEYVVDCRKTELKPKEFLNTVFDEFRLDGYYDGDNKVVMYARCDEDIKKLKKALRRYASDEYAQKVIEQHQSNESKKIKYNTMTRNYYGTSSSRRRTSNRFINEHRSACGVRKGGCGCGGNHYDNNDIFSSVRPSRYGRPVYESRRRHIEGFDDRMFEGRSARRPYASRPYASRRRFEDRMFEGYSERRPYASRRRFEYRDPIFESGCRGKKGVCENGGEAPKSTLKYKGKAIAKMSVAEKKTAKEDIREEIKALKAQIKEQKKAGKSTKKLDDKLEKLQAILNALMGKSNESTYAKFARNRRLFEADEEEEETDDEFGNDEEGEDEEGDEENNADEEGDDETNDDEGDDETEDVEMKAIVLTVKEKDAEKVKDDLIDAGVAEEDITMPDGIEEADEDSEEEVEIKIDVDSIEPLQDYLEGQGINLEDEIGGEIVTDGGDEDDEEGEDETGEESDDEEGDDFGDDFDFDDIFGDEGAEEEE